MELVENAEPTATDDGDQGIDLFRLEPLQEIIGEVDFLDHVVVIDLRT